jgi:NADH-quinone oxidoreductase subunit J
VLVVAQQMTGPQAQQVAPVLFYGLALLTCLSAWAIVLSQNIVRMAVYLLLTLGGAAGIYFLLDAELLAAIQLIVYAGGTLILIVFGVMLTSRNPFLQLRAKTWELALGVAVGLVLAGLLLLALCTSAIKHTSHAQGGGSADYLKVAAIGKSLLSTYLAPFEVAAVLLLVVMIAAAYMARRRNQKSQ